jgi:hypothetical protein
LLLEQALGRGFEAGFQGNLQGLKVRVSGKE